MTRPPLQDVAALAGVSEPTVSRVLNGRVGVADATRRRVVNALESLGYHDVPEPRSPRRNVVGMVCGDYLNPVFAAFTHHISTELARKGWLTTVAATDEDLAPEERCIETLLAAGVDGIVLVAGRHAEVDADLRQYRSLASAGVPMVFVNGADTGLHAPHVRCDEQAGARQAVRHLLRLGHTRIGCLLGSRRYVPTERFIDGYRSTLAAAGIDEPSGAIVETAFTLEGGRAGAARLLDRGVTAMVAGNDLMALGAVTGARAHGGEVSVVGYDGTDFTAYTDPPLTTLRQPFEDMAQLIASAVIGEVESPGHLRDQYVFEPQLLSRDSPHAFRPRAATA
jgi:DNA-binding LacI/PurR family transcriptional regulator